MNSFNLTKESAPFSENVFVYTGKIFAPQGDVNHHVGDVIFADSNTYMLSFSKKEFEEEEDSIIRNLVWPIINSYNKFAYDKSKFKIDNPDLKSSDLVKVRVYCLTAEGIEIGVRIGDEYCIVAIQQKNTFEMFFN